MAVPGQRTAATAFEGLFLAPEAEAMIAKFNNNPITQTPLYVTDVNDPAPGRKVMANFKFPETEVVDTVFPHILVDYAGLFKASDREHRGPTYLNYIPVGMQAGAPYNYTDSLTQTSGVWDPYAPDSSSPLFVPDFPIPYDLDFTIEVNARYRNHIHQLVSQLIMVDYLPDRFGYLIVPQDQTTRTMTLSAGPEFTSTGSDQDGKRLFQAIYRVRVAAELIPWQVQVINNYIHSVNATTKWQPYS